ncbi:hypothetical protein DWY77_02805 [Megamonas rupellensis]|uniref:Uncharacterized protein n=1 Tax=Megamonas rupellensis TaxID=491921 RepID=A0A412CGQ2_9FIRM|nr:hypothetical protein [Megamonas rupellensis]RGQ85553.1 hypothetical protein DWY77_02805 [Megamonas rupellensis]
MRILTKKRYQFGHGDTKVITTGNYAIEDVPDWVEKDSLFKLAKEDGDIEVLEAKIQSSSVKVEAEDKSKEVKTDVKAKKSKEE